jgi:hypothetical protein
MITALESIIQPDRDLFLINYSEGFYQELNERS